MRYKDPVNSSKTTVVVITRNRESYLKNALNSLVKQTVFPDEILVIDNMSTDNTKQLVESFKSRLPVRYLTESKIGTAYARNKGLDESSGEIVAFIDDDCEAEEDWVEKIIEAHRLYPNAAAVQGKIITLPAKGILSDLFKIDYRRWVRLNLQSDDRCYFLDTANTSFKVKKLKKHGIRFDKKMTYYADDVDLSYQMISKDQIIIYRPEISVRSWIRTNIRKYLAARYLKGMARAYLDYKWSFFECPSYISIGKKKLKATDKRLRDFRELTRIQQLVICGYSRSASFSNALYRLTRFFFQYYYTLGYRAGTAQVNQRIFLPSNDIKRVSSVKYTNLEIVIITRNRARLLKRLLFSLMRQTALPMNVVIVDNGSEDETKHIAKQFSKVLPIKYVKEPKIGVPFARNRGLKECSADLVAFIDDDCEVKANWIEEVVGAHKRHPGVAAIQGRVKSYPKNGIFPAIFEAIYSFWFYNSIFHKYYMCIIDTKNVSFKLQKLRSLNLKFDEVFSRGSDVDFASQLLSKSQKIYFSKNILVYHWERVNPVSFFKQRWQIGRARAMFETKWPEASNAIRGSRKSYVVAVKRIGNDLGLFKRTLARLIFKFYGPLFMLSLKRHKRDRDLLLLSPVYKSIGKISIGIITKDRPEMLEYCLFSLFKQRVKPSEVVIVDASRDLRSKKVAALFSKKMNIRYILQKKKGLSNARNIVLKNSTEDIVGFIDDDCEVEIGWVESMLAAHKKYPEAVIIQGSCLVKPYSGVISHVFQSDYNWWTEKGIILNNNLIRVDIENSSLKRDFLIKNQISFDEDKKDYYCEDIDLSYQVLKKGGELKYYPEAILNINRRSLFGLLIQRIKKGYSAALLDIKWGQIHNKRKIILSGKIFELHKSNSQGKGWSGSIKELPKVGNFKSIFKLPLIAAYHLLFILSYSYTRSKNDLDSSRLKKSYLPKIREKILFKSSISVMVITKNRSENLRNLLDSLSKQEFLPKEIILVDSSNESVKPILLEFPKLKFRYVYEKKPGFSVARNKALRLCKTEIIATVDDDARVPKDWILNINKLHQLYPEAVAIQGRIISEPSNSLISTVEQMHMDKWFLRNLEHSGRFNTISTKNISFKVGLLKKNRIKFRETELFNYYGGEDVDIGNQIVSKSALIHYSADIYIYHTERKTLLGYLKQRIRKGGAGALISANWGHMPYRGSYSFCPRIIEPFILPLRLLKLKQLSIFYPLIVIIYYLAEVSFMQGKRGVEMAYILQYSWSLNKTRLADSTIGVLVESGQSVKPIIEPLINQSLKTKEILFSLDAQDIRNERIINQLSRKRGITILKSAKGKISRINELIRNSRTEVLCILSSNNIPSTNWAENLVRAQMKKKGLSIVQGRTLFKGDFLKSHVVSQFIWQTLMRNSMLTDRENFWEWMEGASRINYGLNVVDINNFSIKLGGESIKFNRNFQELSAAIYFAKSQIERGNPVTMDTESKARVPNPPSFREFIFKGYKDGKGAVEGEGYFLKSQNYLTSINIPKRIIAFIYFALNRGVFWQLPFVTSLYLLYLGAFYMGVINGKSKSLSFSKRVIKSI